VADPASVRGGVVRRSRRRRRAQVTLLQRKAGKHGARGWARPPAGSTAPR
jgi:hypothetical protein